MRYFSREKVQGGAKDSGGLEKKECAGVTAERMPVG